MGPIRSSDTVKLYQTTRHHISEDSIRNISLTGTGCDGLGRIQLGLDMVHWGAPVNTPMEPLIMRVGIPSPSERLLHSQQSSLIHFHRIKLKCITFLEWQTCCSWSTTSVPATGFQVASGDESRVSCTEATYRTEGTRGGTQSYVSVVVREWIRLLKIYPSEAKSRHK
jgi:hypothetical protein